MNRSGQGYRQSGHIRRTVGFGAMGGGRVVWIIMWVCAGQVVLGVVNPSGIPALGRGQAQSSSLSSTDDDFELPSSGEGEENIIPASPQPGLLGHRTSSAEDVPAKRIADDNHSFVAEATTSVGDSQSPKPEAIPKVVILDSDDEDLSLASGAEQPGYDLSTRSNPRIASTTGAHRIVLALFPKNGEQSPTSANEVAENTNSAVVVGAVGDQASAQEEEDVTKLPVFAIAMAALTSGVVFFFLGFFCRRRVQKYNEDRTPYGYSAVPNGNGGSRGGTYVRGSIPTPGAGSYKTSPSGSHIELRVIGPDEEVDNNDDSKGFQSNGDNVPTVHITGVEDPLHSPEPHSPRDTPSDIESYHPDPVPTPSPSPTSATKLKNIWNRFTKQEPSDGGGGDSEEEEDIDAIVAMVTASKAAEATPSTGAPESGGPSPKLARSPQTVSPPSSPWERRADPHRDKQAPGEHRRAPAERGSDTPDTKTKHDKPPSIPTAAPPPPSNPSIKNGHPKIDSSKPVSAPLPNKGKTIDNKGDEALKSSPAGDAKPDSKPTAVSKIPQKQEKRRFQSPINIETPSAGCDVILKRNPLYISYSAAESTFIKNTGYTIKISFDSQSSIKGGPLGPNSYELDHMLLHWGYSDGCGSEHTLDGSTYAGELQLVHWNKKLYRNLEEASTHNDGLANIAVFMKIGNRPHSALDKITSHLGQVTYKGQLTEVEDVLSPADFLPGNMSNYWTYAGSLTIEPYSESVTWVVIKEPIVVSRLQMRSLRSLYAHEMFASRAQQRCMADNFRSRQHLEDRKVKASFS